MERTWIKHCVNEQGETVVEETIAEAVVLIQPFPTWEEFKEAGGWHYERMTPDRRFTVQVEEGGVGDGARYHTVARLKANIRPSASHDTVAYVCIEAEECDSYAAFLAAKAARHKAAYEQLVELILSATPAA